MIEMTPSSRHRIRNSSPGGLRPSTLPLGHGCSPQYWLSHVHGEETFFVSFKLPRPGTKPRTLAWKAAVLTTTLGLPSCRSGNISEVLIFANFERRTNSRIQESRENYYYNSTNKQKKNANSRLFNFVKSPKIRNSRKFKHISGI